MTALAIYDLLQLLEDLICPAWGFLCIVWTHRLHHIAPLQLPVLRPAHREPARPSAIAETVAHGPMLISTVLERGPRDLRFAIFVACEHILEFLLVAFHFVLDFASGAVRRPEVGVAAVGEEGCGGDGEGGC